MQVFSAKKLLHFYFFFKYHLHLLCNAREKNSSNLSGKNAFFLEFLGSLKKVPKRLSFLKTSKMGVVEVEFHRSQIMIEIKKD